MHQKSNTKSWASLVRIAFWFSCIEMENPIENELKSHKVALSFRSGFEYIPKTLDTADAAIWKCMKGKHFTIIHTIGTS